MTGKELFMAEPITNEDEDICVTLEMDDGTSVECEILTIFDIDGQDYIVLLPPEEDSEDEDETPVFIYRYFEDEDGNPSLENIADDEEYEAVSARFDELVEEADLADED